MRATHALRHWRPLSVALILTLLAVLGLVSLPVAAGVGGVVPPPTTEPPPPPPPPPPATTEAPPAITTYELTIASVGNGTVTPGTGRYTVESGTRVNLSTTPAADWVFSRWEGQVADAKAPVTSVVVTGDMTVTSYFVETPLVISGVQAVNITRTGAEIVWTTNRNANGTVEYSPGALTVPAAVANTSQKVTLSGLQPVTAYTFKVMAKDAAGNEAISPDYTFTTAGAAAGFILDGTFDVADVSGGKKVTFNGTVRNTGDLSGTFNAELLINGAVEGAATVDIGPGAEKSLSFSAVRNTAGSYSARVADIVKDFTVEQPVGLAVVSPVTAGGSSSIMWLVLVLLAAALLFFL